MFINNIITLIHITILYGIIISPLVNDYYYKKLILIFLIFLCFQFLSKYGKCGLINMEKYFLKDNFKNGIVYRIIKPIICYKINPFYKYYFEIILLYIFILFMQLYTNGHDLNIFNEFKLVYNSLKQRVF